MLELLKTMPFLLGICYFCNSLLSYFYIDNFVLSHIAGVSLIPFVYIYASSFLFKFCIYHRLPLDYIAVNECINIYDYYCGIPVSNIDLLLIHIIIAWLIDDEDAYDGIVFNRWYADMSYTGVAINWEDFLQ